MIQDEKLSNVQHVIKEFHIDWGTVGNQISAVNVPVADTASYFSGSNIEDVLTEVVPRSAWNQNGVEDRTLSTTTFTDGTRTFSIQPTGADFSYYIAGVKYTTTGDTVVITDVEGVHAIYYDGATLTSLANPTSTQVSSVIRTKTIVGYIGWNATDKEAIYVGEERHGKNMSPSTHNYLHFKYGLDYRSGLGLNTMSVDGTGVTVDAQFGVDAGAVADEDLYILIDAVLSTTGLPIYYMLGAGPRWVRYLNVGFSVRTLDGTSATKLAYNEYTGGSWQLTEASNYVLYHIFGTTEKDKPMISVMGQSDYLTKAGAREGATVEIHELVLNNVLFPEIRPIATVIYQTKSTYTNDVNARIVSTDEGDDYIDWRDEVISRVGLSTSDHATLTNLGWLGSGHNGTVSTIAGFDGSGNATEYTEADYFLLDGSRSITGDLTVTGNFTVSGTITTLDTQTVQATDNEIVINYGETGAGVTSGLAGIRVDRGTATDYLFHFDETSDTFKIGEDGSLQVVATREDTPNDNGLGFWDSATFKFETDANLTWDGTILKVGGSTNGELQIYNASNVHGGTIKTGADQVLRFYNSDSEEFMNIGVGGGLQDLNIQSGGGSAIFGGNISLSSGKVISSADEDLVFTLGRAGIGYNSNATYTDDAVFAHRDRMAYTDAALRQTELGYTVIGAPTGTTIQLQNSSATITTIDSDGLTMAANMNIAMSGTSTVAGILHSDLLDKSAAETITGAWRFDGGVIIDTDTGVVPFYISRDGSTNQALKYAVDDDEINVTYSQDETGTEDHDWKRNIISGASGAHAHVYMINSIESARINSTGLTMGANKNIAMSGTSTFTTGTGTSTFNGPIRVNYNSYNPKIILNDNTTTNKVPIEFRANNVVKWEIGQRPTTENFDFVIYSYDGTYHDQLRINYDTSIIEIGGTLNVNGATITLGTTGVGAILNNNTDQYNIISGGNATDVGANLVLYGSTHANANTFSFRASGTEIAELDASGNFQIDGTLTISTIAAETTDVDKFLVSNAGLVKYRTGAQVLSDIGGAPLLSPTFTGNVTVGGDLYVDGGDIFGPTDNALKIHSDGNIRLYLDADNDGTNTFDIFNGTPTNIFSIDESGNTTIAGDLTMAATKSITLGGNAVDDIFISSDGSGAGLDDTLATAGWVAANTATSASPTFSGTVTMPDSSTWTSTRLTVKGQGVFFEDTYGTNDYGFLCAPSNIHLCTNAYFTGSWKSLVTTTKAVIIQTSSTHAMNILVDSTVTGADQALTPLTVFNVDYSGNLVVTGEVEATSLDINGTGDISGSLTASSLIADTGGVWSTPTYSTTLISPYRDLYIDDGGKFGYISSNVDSKKEILELPDVEHIILNVNAFNFKYNESSTLEWGWIAEHLIDYIPDSIWYKPIYDEDKNPVGMDKNCVEGFQQGHMVPILWKQVQKLTIVKNEQDLRILKLEKEGEDKDKKIEDLEARLLKIEQYIENLP